MRLAAFAPDSVGRMVQLRALLPMVREDAAQVWINVAFEGTWEGHPSGAFTFDRECFDAIVRNYDANPNPVPLDYEHATEWANEAPAAGWIQALEVRVGDDGRAHLWALAELTERAAAQVREGAYRFSSGVFDFGAIDLVTGEPVGCAMTSIALTNTPFIRGQEPIRLSQRAARVALGASMQINKTTLLEKLGAALGEIEGDEVELAQIEALLAALGSVEEAMSGPAEDEPEPEAEMADEPEQPAALDAASAPTLPAPLAEDEPLGGEPEPAEESPAAAGMLLSRLMEATGMDEAGLLAALDERLEAVAGVLSGEMTDAESAPLSAQVATLSTRIAGADATIVSLTARLAQYTEREETERRASASAAVDALVESGVLQEALREPMLTLALTDRADFDARAEALRAGSPLVPTAAHAALSASQRGPDSTSVDEVSDEDRQRYARRYLADTGLSETDKLKLAGERLARLKKNSNGRGARSEEMSA